MQGGQASNFAKSRRPEAASGRFIFQKKRTFRSRSHQIRWQSSAHDSCE